MVGQGKKVQLSTSVNVCLEKMASFCFVTAEFVHNIGTSLFSERLSVSLKETK